MNQLQKLAQAGQSIWLDFIQRKLITSGELAHMVAAGLRGVTSNPAIFEKAVASSSDYDEFLGNLNATQTLRPVDFYEALAIRDVQDAANIFAQTYAETKQRDGYVSLEVSPHLALDPEGTLLEARRLWAWVNRPNVMIKVPGTLECIPVIQQLITDGINVNVTLLFSQTLYAKAAEAYINGIEARFSDGLPISHVASVASFFVSRIDSAVDKVAPPELAGKAAIANAKLAYQFYKELYASPRWKKLAAIGAQTQRLLWASTGTKNPSYRDVLYVEELIGPDTINTVPPATYEAFLDHGDIKHSLESNLPGAKQVMQDLKSAGINFNQITDTLLGDGIKLFVEPFDKMLAAIETKHPAKITQVKNLWEEAKNNPWLGWLDVFINEPAPGPLVLEGDEIKSIVLLGMGGSSLAPDVMSRIFGPFPNFRVIDSTDPDQIAATQKQLDIPDTLFIVSSKSGTTLEPNILFDYFFDKSQNPNRFVAITDPGSALEQLAKQKGFAAVYTGIKSIGGRYSALSCFGLIPAALMGVDVVGLLKYALRMREACKTTDARENPGARLGLTLGHLALQGRNKVTLITSKRLEPLGDWIEQLLAESTGKHGKGLVPVVGETVGTPEVYGGDRTFVYMHLAGDMSLAKSVEALERAGHPVIRIEVPDLNHVGAEFYRWEIATVFASSVLGVNAFDQPDVELAKEEARKMMDAPKIPHLRQGFAGQAPTDVASLLATLKPGDYFAIQAFVPMNPETKARLQKLRQQVRDAHHVATTLGFGPRFLHSTGQLHKGGPNTAVCLQVVSEPQKDLQVPGKSYTFNKVKRAQALGDLTVLTERGRRIVSISWETLCRLA